MDPLQLLNPLGALMEWGAKLVGLPPEAANVAQVAVGAATSNVLMVADGAVQLVAQQIKAGALTEYVPSSGGDAGGASGYAVDRQRLDALRALHKNFKEAEVAGAFLKIPDGLLGPGDLEALAHDPRVGSELKRAAQFFLDHPDEYTAIAHSRSMAMFPVPFVSQSDMDDALDAAQAQQKTPNTCIPPITQPWTPTGPRDPDAPGGTGDCPPKSTAPPDGTCSTPCSRDGDASSTATTASRIKEILNDPNLSVEDKLRAILWEVMGAMDKEMLSLGADMDDVAEQRKGLTQDDNDKSEDLKRSMEKLSDRFQSVTEKRQAMFELLSNLTLKQGEMAMRAMSNLGR